MSLDNYKRIGINTKTAMMVGLAALTLGGCDMQQPDTREQQMQRAQQVEHIDYSVERDNINYRLKVTNDPNQIMWIYCLSDMGQVLLTSPVRGKVSSSTKRLEPTTIEGSHDTMSYLNEVAIGGYRFYTKEVMGADGAYGASDPYVYWRTPEGQYMQWNGKYIESSVPLKLSTPVFNMRDIDYDMLGKAKAAENALKAGKPVSNSLELK